MKYYINYEQLGRAIVNKDEEDEHQINLDNLIKNMNSNTF